MQSWHHTRWHPNINWDTSAGVLLKRVVRVLGKDEPVTINIFGSAPLQMGVATNMASNDLDILELPGAEQALRNAHLLEGQAEPYVEVCDPGTFTASSNWRDRAHVEVIGNVSVVFPHPIDILVSKIKRMAEKDYQAFEHVIEQTGHPTESELKESLQRVVDIYRPSFDEEASLDPLSNTRLLWQRLFGKDIDVREDIIAPGILNRKKNYSDTPQQQLPAELLRRASKN